MQASVRSETDEGNHSGFVWLAITARPPPASSAKKKRDISVSDIYTILQIGADFFILRLFSLLLVRIHLVNNMERG